MNDNGITGMFFKTLIVKFSNRLGVWGEVLAWDVTIAAPRTVVPVAVAVVVQGGGAFQSEAC